MSVEKVTSYLERRTKSTFRKGYEEVLEQVKSEDSESQIRTIGSVDRTETLIGIGTNNRAEGFHFEEKHLSTTEKYEQQAQLAFNEEYMKRADELDKLRIAEAVSQFASGLQEGHSTSFSDMIQERVEEVHGISETPPSDSFQFSELPEEVEEVEEEVQSGVSLEDLFLAGFGLSSAQGEVQEFSFAEGFKFD
jgi:hypothetical protein